MEIDKIFYDFWSTWFSADFLSEYDNLIIFLSMVTAFACIFWFLKKLKNIFGGKR